MNSLVEATNQELIRIIPNAAIPLYRVPGAFEIPVCAEFLMQNTEIDAIIALGVVIRGETAHADLVATSVTNSLQGMSTTHLIPVINEVLLLDNEEQARVRCLSPDYNRGIEAAGRPSMCASCSPNSTSPTRQVRNQIRRQTSPRMGKRREGREAAVQFLFCSDINPELNPSDIDGFFSTIRPASPRVREFATVLATGVCEHRAEIDSMIEKHTENYRLERVSAVDRSILRLAIYEILFRDDIPNVVSINEAIEVAKRFGTEESGRFVNGILDNLHRILKRQGTAKPEAPGEDQAAD